MRSVFASIDPRILSISIRSSGMKPCTGSRACSAAADSAVKSLDLPADFTLGVRTIGPGIGAS